MDRRKTFEFRMCKKVAELTQVVHMLFMRNHEKEMELDAVRAAYEEEIERVLKDARGRLSGADQAVESAHGKAGEQAEKIRRQYEAELQLRQQESEHRLKESERSLREERAESQHLRDLLIAAHKALEVSKAGLQAEQSERETEAAARAQEVKNAHVRAAQAERALREAEAAHQEAAAGLEAANVRLLREAGRREEALEASRKSREQWTARAKQLEGEVKGLRREMTRRMSDQLPRAQGQAISARKTSIDTEAPEGGEVDALRKELSRYKMELSNRDHNFNRVFSDHHPVVVDPRAGKVNVAMAPATILTREAGTVFGGHRMSAKGPLGREKSFAAQNHVLEDDPVHLLRSSSRPTSCHRLPNMDSSSSLNRNVRLSRPRPPAKEDLQMTRSVV